MNIKQLLEREGFVTSETVTEQEDLMKHRDKVIERSAEERKLKSIWNECVEKTKTQKDPTDDLIFLPKGVCREEISMKIENTEGFFIGCRDTEQCWIAPDEACLNKNFIYREDLFITNFSSKNEVIETYLEFNKDYMSGVMTRESCYILDNPGNETYEVYYDSNYPTLHYGIATPRGTFIHKYKDRFHRDMAILGLDELYSSSSGKEANKFTDREFKNNEAIIISDGAWLRNVCSYCFFYLDKDGVAKQSSIHYPTEPDQAVLIAELTGAYHALKMCRDMHKTKVTYYYDNTSIVNVFNNKKTEYIEEVKKFKDLVRELNDKGFQVNFVEIHPKTGENRENENKALMYFHNACDSECRQMSDIFKKDYKTYATTGNREGQGLNEVIKKGEKKGKGNFNKPKNNNMRR